jgi:RNA polymerase sigma-70 factor (ECF subfamily)
MSEQNLAERRRVERARESDRPAQQELWREHRRWVAAIVLAHKPRGIEVDDLMQEVAVKFVSRINTLRDAEAFRPWLRQIILNVCRGAARSWRPSLHLGEEDRSAIDNADSIRASGPSVPVPAAKDGLLADTVERADAAKRLMDQALTLPSEYREPLLLRCVRSMTYQQIAKVLDLPITTIETRLARARRMLREELGEGDAVEPSLGS